MWKRIELHCHTTASDGDMSPQELVSLAKKRNYSAIAITDHNTTSGIKLAQDAAENLGIAIIPAIEWTTFWGHIVISGGNTALDWRRITASNIDKCLRIASDSHDFVTLAHPKRIGTPFCGGCYNHFKISNWSAVHAFEVWSHYYPNTHPTNDAAFKMWQELLSCGINTAAVYGYDWHCEDDLHVVPPFAYTYINCNSLSVEDITLAVKCRHTYITMGVELDLTLTPSLTDNRSATHDVPLTVKSNATVENVKNCDNTICYSIGDNICCGNYSLNIATQLSSDYAKRFSATPKTFAIVNATLHTSQVFPLSENKATFLIKLEKGLVFVRIDGIFEGQDAPLAITSAWTVE